MTARPFELMREPAAMPAIETDYDDHGSMRSRGPVVKAEHLYPTDLLRRGHRSHMRKLRILFIGDVECLAVVQCNGAKRGLVGHRVRGRRNANGRRLGRCWFLVGVIVQSGPFARIAGVNLSQRQFVVTLFFSARGNLCHHLFARVARRFLRMDFR